MSDRIFKISREAGIEKATELFQLNRHSTSGGDRNGAGLKSGLPVLIGAGISFTAGIPLNAELLARISGQRNSKTESYEELYQQLVSLYDADFPTMDLMKSNLRGFLVDGGIPRLSDSPIPNLSNLYILHLLVNNFIGPVTSLNVDPLLTIAQRFFRHESTRDIKFVQNTSQFSDLAGRPLGESKVIYQPHGTIEEPLSLRFANEELIGTKSLHAVQRTLVESIDAHVGFLACGVNLLDDVATSLLQSWIAQNEEKNLQFLTTSFKSISDEEFAALERLVESHKTIKIYVAEDCDSDEFWGGVVDLAVRKTKISRSNSDPMYHVNSASVLRLQHQILTRLFDEQQISQYGYKRLPEDEVWLMLEVCIHAIESRAPFSLADVVRNCGNKIAFERVFDQAVGIKRFSNALNRLIREKVVVPFGSEGMVSDVRLDGYSNYEDIDQILLVRSPLLNTPELFVDEVFRVLGLRSENASVICDHVRSVELEREAIFDQRRAVSASVYFQNSNIVSSHYELDAKLDKIKAKFAKEVEQGANVRGLVITESGEHLFKGTNEGLYESLEKAEANGVELRDKVRNWIRAVLDSPTGDETILSIIIADTGDDWVFDHAQRSERDRIVKDLVAKLDEHPNIDVRVLPWDKHNDHMWVYKDEAGHRAEGILFPRHHGEQTFFGLHVEGEKDVNKLVQVFDRHNRGAYPINSEKIHHVVALSIVRRHDGDMDRKTVSNEDEILIGVRSPDTNAQHANIACVPTQRVPAELFESIAGSNTRVSSDAKSKHLDGEWVPGGRGSGHHGVAYAINSILASKLDLNHALEVGDFEYMARPTVLKSDYSPLLTEQDVPEYLAMLNALVFVHKCPNDFPKSTSSYNRLEWVKVRDFLQALAENKTKGVLNLGEGAEATDFECGGVCVCTTEVLLSSMEPSE